MNWKPVIVTTVIAGMGGIAYVAYRYFSRQSELLNQYEVKPIAFEVLKISQQEVVIRATLRFTNKSAIEATIKSLYSDVYLGDTNVGYVINDQPVLIPASGTGDIKIQFSFDPRIILKNIVELLVGAAQIKDVSYRLKGYVKLQSGFVPISVPFESSGKLSDYL